jgi:hypothetical protein
MFFVKQQIGERLGVGGHALGEHAMQDVDSAASKAEDGLVVALALGTPALVVGA